MRCSGASFCAFPWFALSSALLCTHTPCPLQGPCTSGRAEQHCGTEASQAWRHPPARVSWLPPGMLQIWHPTSWKQKQKCSHCCSQVPSQCSPGWSIADMTHWSISSIAGNSPCGCTGNCKCFYTTAVIPQESQSPTCVTTSRHPNVMPKHFIYNFPASVQRGLGSLQLRIWWSNDQWVLKFGNFAQQPNTGDKEVFDRKKKSSYLLKYFPSVHVGAKSKRDRKMILRWLSPGSECWEQYQ